MYKLDNFGIFMPEVVTAHRNEEYAEKDFDMILEMQALHFWYLGRHKFIFEILARNTNLLNLSVLDLGGGCGGWIKYLQQNKDCQFKKLALADSSRIALTNAKKILSPEVDLFQADLMNLGFDKEWDVAFLLDVIEHCPDDITIVKNAMKALKPGGLLIITSPALELFWSYNDDCVNHLRRYDKKMLENIAIETGSILRDSRYFMFFLSPLYWILRRRKLTHLTEKKIKEVVEKEHKIPHPLINSILASVFKLETPIGHMIQFPWGTSVIGVFEKRFD